MINATEKYCVPGISADAYFAMYADDDGRVTLPDTATFAEPKEDVSFNDDCIFLKGNLYNVVEKGVYGVYCTGRERGRPVFYGLINISKEMFDQYFRLIREQK